MSVNHLMVSTENAFSSNIWKWLHLFASVLLWTRLRNTEQLISNNNRCFLRQTTNSVSWNISGLVHCMKQNCILNKYFQYYNGNIELWFMNETNYIFKKISEISFPKFYNITVYSLPCSGIIFV